MRNIKKNNDALIEFVISRIEFMISLIEFVISRIEFMISLNTVQITFIFIDFAFAFKMQNAPCVSRFNRVLFSDRFQFAF